MFQRLEARKARSWLRYSKPLYICAYIHRYMASKTISIRDDVYDLLKGTKREDESFSDAIERLVRKDRTDLSEYFGALKDSPLLDEIEADSRKVRDMARSRI
jgi:predicted CopG family antitoxin